VTVSTVTATRTGVAVETTGLTKSFGERKVVDALDLSIPLGSVCGFVGPNGAGKTTTIRMLLGLIRPTAGSGQILGEPLTTPERYLNRVGALIESPAFYPTLSGRANLLALARLGRVDPDVIDPALTRVGLHERGDDKFRSYSLGMKQRLGIAAALLVNPDLVILDEPANGLDPAGIVETRALIRSLADDGITVFVSSHLLGEIEQICDHLVMIRDGRIVFQGATRELQSSQGTELVARPEHHHDVTVLAELAKQSGYPARLADDAVVIDADPSWAAPLNRLAMESGITLVHLSERRRSLEDAFFELTGTASGDTPVTASLGEIK
jgi:ABC-2 type transport system ATP-binding protein